MLAGYSWCENYQLVLFTWNMYLALFGDGGGNTLVYSFRHVCSETGINAF